jgi:hypothetical protein
MLRSRCREQQSYGLHSLVQDSLDFAGAQYHQLSAMSIGPLAVDFGGLMIWHEHDRLVEQPERLQNPLEKTPPKIVAKPFDLTFW